MAAVGWSAALCDRGPHRRVPAAGSVDRRVRLSRDLAPPRGALRRSPLLAGDGSLRRSLSARRIGAGFTS